MKIIKHTHIPESELLNKLRLTRLRGFGQPEVYKDSYMEIVDSFIHVLNPCQNYVLQSTVDDILELHSEFSNLGIDIFHLTGAVLFWLEGSNPETDPSIPLLPPIVEYSDTESRWIINDGMHRVYAASTVGRKINVVLISGKITHPYYAYPLPNAWADVFPVSTVPDTRKEYRNPEDYKALFRDFNSLFPGVQKKRT